jgi:hypothetical protein
MPSDTVAQRRQRDVERCVALLDKQSDGGVLGAACAEASAQLRSGVFDADAIDRRLLGIARTVFDVESFERRAHEKLASIRPRMPVDAYREAVRGTIDQLLRDHAKLPDLGTLADSNAGAPLPLEVASEGR